METAEHLDQIAFLGSSPGALAVREKIGRAARVECPVLVLGESGVGKELVARQIHARSRRSCSPFITVNCSAIPDTLIESELFGHSAGAFTDARRSRRGAFELASSGTLFLDEVADLSSVAQPKLLRAIELKEIRGVGEEKTRRIDLRIVAATNQDLRRMRTEGSFREDLYYRLDILEIRIPPLRERPEDIAQLADHFAQQISRREKLPYRSIEQDAMRLLSEHTWPGNARELRAVIERALAWTSSGNLNASHLTLEPAHPGLTLRKLLSADWQTAHREFERAYMVDLFRRNSGNLRAVARAARLSPRGVYKILHRLGLTRRPR